MNFASTATFYRSKEWEQCKAQVLQRETQRGNGAVICPHCGKPILKSFSPSERNNKGAMVFHHTIPLTNLNVNEADISINPDRIQILHWSCHNEIHQRFAGGQAERKVYLVTGSPCSGKTSFVRERAEANDLILDIDDIWEMASGQPRYIKPNALKPIIFRLRDEMKDLISKGVGQWRNAYVIESLPSSMDRRREAERYKAFNVEVIIMPTSEAECLDRLRENPNGRDPKAYEGYIREYFARFSE